MKNKFTLTAGMKGFPLHAAPLQSDAIGEMAWNVLAGDLPLPIALLKREALEHNVLWMQRQAHRWGIDLAPHGKTTMSPQLFTRQLDAGAWGMTFATVNQAMLGVNAGARRVVIANQVITDIDLSALQAMLGATPGLRIVFLVDSLQQLGLIETWSTRHAGAAAFEVMLEVGLQGARCGVRTEQQAIDLARRIHQSTAVRLVGIECYEGLIAKGETAHDAPAAKALMDRVEAIARLADQQGLFECDEVLVSAGGSAIFDLVAERLKPALGRAVRGLLRSGCYITHDHGVYKRLVKVVDERCGFSNGLSPALEVWAAVQSCPEPGLAILAVGKRDVSFDLEMPTPFARAALGSRVPDGVPASWRITGLNDQHAYLRWDAADEALAPQVGERVGLGISHPCTTFDKWHWLPIVEQDYLVTDAVQTLF